MATKKPENPEKPKKQNLRRSLKYPIKRVIEINGDLSLVEWYESWVLTTNVKEVFTGEGEGNASDADDNLSDLLQR